MADRKPGTTTTVQSKHGSDYISSIVVAVRCKYQRSARNERIGPIAAAVRCKHQRSARDCQQRKRIIPQRANGGTVLIARRRSDQKPGTDTPDASNYLTAGSNWNRCAIRPTTIVASYRRWTNSIQFCTANRDTNCQPATSHRSSAANAFFTNWCYTCNIATTGDHRSTATNCCLKPATTTCVAAKRTPSDILSTAAIRTSVYPTPATCTLARNATAFPCTKDSVPFHEKGQYRDVVHPN